MREKQERREVTGISSSGVHVVLLCRCVHVHSTKRGRKHYSLFEHQQALDDTHLVHYAVALHLDEETFKREMTTHVYANRVREDFLSGVRSGVNGTPTFYINGVRHDASYALETLLAAIEAAMSS